MIIKVYENSSAACEPYDPCAPEVAIQIAMLINSNLPSVVVEHFGSTAVPRCPGKGIIDLMLLYPEGELESTKCLLDFMGFQHQSTRDPFPEERPMRVGALDYAGKTFRIHAHVLSANSCEAADLRLFRDLLRNDEKLLGNYIKAKQEIISSGAIDPIDYCEAKGKFIEKTFAKSR